MKYLSDAKLYKERITVFKFAKIKFPISNTNYNFVNCFACWLKDISCEILFITNNIIAVFMFFRIIFVVFAVSFISQIFYYTRIFIRLLFYNKTSNNIAKDPVSIIICARNEEKNLVKHLPMILEQDYPEYEVIVVNDRSEDNTEEILKKFKNKYPFLYSTRIKEGFSNKRGKKLAITLGIKASRNEWLLFTDADCRIKSNKWLAEMQKNFSPDKKIILGYGAYSREKGLLNKFIRTDTFLIAFNYLNFALAGFPYMGVGRNIAYRRSLFFANRGFASHYFLPSGDDDLFVNETATFKNTGIEISDHSYTFSESPENLKEWLKIKSRHITTSKYYTFKTRMVLGFELISRTIFYTCFIILLFNSPFLFITIILFFIRLISQTIIIKLNMKRLNEKDLLLSSLAYDIIYLFFGLLLKIINQIDHR